MRAMDDAIHRMIFFEACHALNFSSDKTKAKLHVFQRCVFAEFAPKRLDDVLIELRNFTDGDLNIFNVRRTFMLDELIEQ